MYDCKNFENESCLCHQEGTCVNLKLDHLLKELDAIFERGTIKNDTEHKYEIFAKIESWLDGVRSKL